MDQENPVIEELVKSSGIILLQNGLKQDIQILSNAYNLVGSVSSFFSTSLLNINLFHKNIYICIMIFIVFQEIILFIE